MADYDDPRPSSQPVGSTDLAVAKDNLITFDRLLVAPAGTAVSNRKGEQLTPWIDLAGPGYQIVGDFADVTKVEITKNNQVYTSKSVAGLEDALWRTNQVLPYTPTGSDPTQAPEEGKWTAVAVGELTAIARSLNVLDTQVIYSTDTTTPIVKYIYDATAEKTYSVPNAALGKTIDSVVGTTLTTTEPAVYTLIEVVGSDSELSAIARSLNVLDSQVIYSTDTVTVLDNVLYIYDPSNQTTWGVPTLDSAGKTIANVAGNALNTSGGTGSNTYTMLKADTANVQFNTVSEMQLAAWLEAGSVATTATTSWRINSSVGSATGVYLPITDTKGAFPISDLDIAAFGSIPDADPETNTGTDNSVAIQACWDFAGTATKDVSVNGFHKYNSTLTWKAPSFDYFSDKGIMLKGSNRTTCGLVGNNHDCIDLAGAELNAIDITLSGYGASGGSEYTAIVIFDSVRPGDCFVRLVRCAVNRADVSINGLNGTWLSYITGVDFKFVKTGLRIERFYAGSITECNFICRTAIESTDTSIAAAKISGNHFALGTYSSIFGGVETTLKLRTEGVSLKDNYFETYAALPAGSVILDMQINQQDKSDVSNNYFNLGQAVDGVIIRKLNIQTGFPSTIRSETSFKRNRIIAPTQAILDTWWTTDTGGITYEHDSEKVSIATGLYPYNQQKCSFDTALTYTEGTTAKTIDLNEWVTNESIINRNMLTPSGTINLDPGYYKIAWGGRITGVASKQVQLKLASSGGRNYFATIVAATNEADSGEIALYVPFAEEWTVSFDPAGYSVGEVFTVFDLTLLISKADDFAGIPS